MSKGGRRSVDGAMLELWRPPPDAGDPIGCLATTYTFSPGLFDEYCLARFLEIESEPNREDLAYLLERETRLGGVYAGVLVDHTRAGVEHSLRWDVLPVRIARGKQHAKISVLAWSRRVRIVVASANLTEPGYRANREVASAVELAPTSADTEALDGALEFLRRLLALVPGASANLPEVGRAAGFLDRVAAQVSRWQRGRASRTTRQTLAFTLPASGLGQPSRSSLNEAVNACRRRGASPHTAWIASPFFDIEGDVGQTTRELCKTMARGGERSLRFCVPGSRPEEGGPPRLDAPKELLLVPPTYNGRASIEMLPSTDADRNPRTWHAKMLALQSDGSSALLIGSSNFTRAGMGVGPARNAEANLLTIVDRKHYGRETRELEAVWPETTPVEDPESAEWLGARPDPDDEASTPPVPAGFVCASYRAGADRRVVLRFDPPQLPPEWTVGTCGHPGGDLTSSAGWRGHGSPEVMELAWESDRPPEKLLVRWSGHQGFMSINVEDRNRLPPLPQLEQMSAEEMLAVLAAADPSAAFRAWAARQQPQGAFDPELDAAAPSDLNPLNRYDLQTTFLHRTRRRARVLAQMRANLQRPVWGRQALEWRLRGLVGLAPLADRLLREVIAQAGAPDEALLGLADFLIVLSEVDYEPSDGAISKSEFDSVFSAFLRELAKRMAADAAPVRSRISNEMGGFWDRVVERCRS